jgi:hypothetical protein
MIIEFRGGVIMKSFRIRNNTGREVILRLNSGRGLFIESGATSREIPDEEVNNNPMVINFQEQRIISVKESIQTQG